MEKLFKKAAEAIEKKLNAGGFTKITSIQMTVTARKGFIPSNVYAPKKDRIEGEYTITIEPVAFQDIKGVWTSLVVGTWGKMGTNRYMVEIDELENEDAN